MIIGGIVNLMASPRRGEQNFSPLIHISKGKLRVHEKRRKKEQHIVNLEIIC